MKLRIFTEPQQGATYDQLLAVAKLTEELGFDAFFRSDHYLRIGDGPLGVGSTDAWITLAALGRETSRIRLGTLVTPVTFRFPGPLAIQVAQADAMSGGRIELGLGAGWYDREHAAFGIPFPSTGDRFEMLEEQLTIIDGVWTTPVGETFTFAGKHHSIDASPALPKPVQRPRPPIILGGWGTKRTPRLAARYADEFNMPFAPASYFREGCDHVRVACEKIERDPSTMRFTIALVGCVGSDEAEFTRRTEAIGHKPDELRANAAGGLPHEVVARLQEFAAAGAETAYLQVLDLDDLDHLRLIASEVAPHISTALTTHGDTTRMDVRFGVHAGLQHTNIAELRDLWARIEALDFDWISIWDHFYAADATGDPHCLEAITTHTALALSTTNVTCGSLVYSAGYRHPAVLANAMATLDQIANGRVVLGLGGGWLKNEYNAYGMHYGSPGERLRMLDEYVQCVRGLLTQERTTFAGEFFTLTEAQCEPKPVQARLPIWIGGGGEKVTLRIAAQHADGWNVAFIPPDAWAHKATVLDEHCAAVGRDPSEILKTVNVGMAFTDEELQRQFGRMSDFVKPGVLSGSVQEMVDKVSGYVDAGAQQVILAMRAPFDRDGLERFAADVIPAVRG